MAYGTYVVLYEARERLDESQRMRIRLKEGKQVSPEEVATLVRKLASTAGKLTVFEQQCSGEVTSTGLEIELESLVVAALEASDKRVLAV